ncbi:MAG TPA: ATP-binding protein, partial [Polyangiaceae bacterium]|nr:ATP-binding protein [Polyangiaceae bacterium]
LALWSRSAGGDILPAELGTGQGEQGFQGDQLYLAHTIANAGQVAGTLRVVFSTLDIRARTARFLQIAAVVLLVSALLALALAAVAQRVITRPVQILSNAARRVQEDQDLHVRAQRVSDDELGGLTDAFNSMLSMIQARDAELNTHRQELEQRVRERTRDLDQRNQEMRIVLDNVDQGLLTVDREGRIGAEHSAALATWFGAPGAEARLSDYLERRAPGFGVRMSLAWSQLIEAFLPLEANIAQLPAELEDGGRWFEISYRPIGARGDDFDKLLVIISDVTARVEKERNDAAQAQIIAMLEHVSSDRNGFLDFFEETEATLERLGSDGPRDRVVVMRELHTLKGNFGLFGLKSLATLIHHIESDCQDSGANPTAAQRSAILEAWRHVAGRARTLLGDGALSMTVGRRDVEELLLAIRSGASREELVAKTTRLLLDPVAPKLARIGERARGLAERLGKGHVEVSVDAEGVRAPGDIGWLWHVLPHVVANSVDHGLDTREERTAQGKTERAQLRLVAHEQERSLVVEIADDGRGIDWDRIRAKARGLGLPCESDEQLVQALFADGLTTRDEASEVSGRGVGLAAVDAACREHGARIHISSERGRGTVFAFTLPQTNHARVSAPPQGRVSSVPGRRVLIS